MRRRRQSPARPRRRGRDCESSCERRRFFCATVPVLVPLEVWVGVAAATTNADNVMRAIAELETSAPGTTVAGRSDPTIATRGLWKRDEPREESPRRRRVQAI